MDYSYEDAIEALDTIKGETPAQQEALEQAASAMSFAQSVNELFRDHGAVIPETPDVYLLEQLIDSYMGELAAAVIFLCDDSFQRVPGMLRAISRGLKKQKEDGGADDTPDIVIRGYAKFADRIDNSKVKIAEMAEVLRNQQKDVDNK